MPRVQFTRHLKRFFPALEEMDVPGETVADVVAALDRAHPGLAGYLLDDRGALRKHVNIFVGQDLVQDRARLTDPIPEGAVVFVMQALSGG
jgi:hypothetical protein